MYLSSVRSNDLEVFDYGSRIEQQKFDFDSNIELICAEWNAYITDT